MRVHRVEHGHRLKQKLMNRFRKFGGATARPIARFIVPPGAKTYDDWKKEPEATPVFMPELAAAIVREPVVSEESLTLRV